MQTESGDRAKADEKPFPLPRWKCHKEVFAAQVAKVYFHREDQRDSTIVTGGTLAFEEPGVEPIRVSVQYMNKHHPMPGGYYVRYDDGYESWSPQKSFEDGYTRI